MSILIEILDAIEDESITPDLLLDHFLNLLNENYEASLFLIDHRQEIVDDLARVKQYNEAVKQAIK